MFLPPQCIKIILFIERASIFEEGHAATRSFTALEEWNTIADTAFAGDVLRLNAETTDTADAFVLTDQGCRDGLRRVVEAVAPVM